MSAQILQVTGVAKRFGGVMAVQDVSFDIQPGEILGLIGPNGAGKTTLVNMITGVAAPTRGSIVFEDRPLTGLRPHQIGRMGVARTFQVVRPFANLTVLENVAVGAMYGAGGAKRSAASAMRKADEVLDFVHLSARRSEPAESLGIGGRKRLELAKALAMEPRLLLLDEVMAGLNHVEVGEVVELIKKIRGTGVTILVIEHVMKAIRSLADRLLVLHHGQQIAEGATDQVLSDPKVVEAYLGKRRQ